MAVAPAAVLLAGCGAGSGAGSGPASLPDGPAPAETTVPAPRPTVAADPVAAAYLRYWDAVLAAHRAADPAAGGLAAVAADPELGRVRAAVARNRTQQLSVRGEVRHEPGPPVVSGGTATIEDCYDISGWDPVDLRTGKPVGTVESGGTGRYRARWTLRGAGPSWKVVDRRALGGC